MLLNLGDAGTWILLLFLDKYRLAASSTSSLDAKLS